MSLDLKGNDTGKVVIDVVRDIAPELLPRLWLCHPDWQACSPCAVRRTGPKLVDSTRLARIKEGPERRAATLLNEGIDAINMHHSDWNGGLVTLFHRFNRYSIAWDAQEEHVCDRSSVWVSMASTATTLTVSLRHTAPNLVRDSVGPATCYSATATANQQRGQITTNARPTIWS